MHLLKVKGNMVPFMKNCSGSGLLEDNKFVELMLKSLAAWCYCHFGYQLIMSHNEYLTV